MRRKNCSNFARTPAILCFLILCSRTIAQTEAEKPDQKSPPKSKQASPGDVYINDSFEAADALNKARTLTDQKRWREAAELLQKTADAMPDRVVRTGEGFVGLRSHVAELICHWPGEGLRAYQDLYDAKLQKQTEALGDGLDVDAAVEIFDQYFCASGAAAMADRIAQMAIESGDVPLAQWALTRVLKRHPAGRAYTARYQTLISLASAMAGNPIESPANAEQTRLRWKGRDAALSDVLAEISRDFRLRGSGAQADDWPIFAGNPERNRDSLTSVDDPGLLWRYALNPTPDTGRKGGIVDGLVRGEGEGGRQTAIIPVVAGELIYLQSGREIAAVHRMSGAQAWKFSPEEAQEQDSPYSDDRPIGGLSPVVDEGRLFAALPSNDSSYYDYETSRTVPELVAMDALTGSILWRITQKGVDAQGTVTAYDSSPVARNGRLYILSRRKRSFGFEDCYLDAYRATDGKLLFRTHLASASTSALSVRGATRSIAALQGDSVYISTNLGTIAAVNAYTGSVVWLHLYDRIRPDAPGTAGWSARDAGMVPLNPVIWTSQRIVVLPADAAQLLVLNADNGETIHAIAINKLSNVHTVYGARGDILCGAGEEVFCYDIGKEDTTWTSRLADEAALSGRGMWVGDELFIPRRNGLSRVNVANGKVQSFSMGPHFSGGSVLALPEQILIAGSKEMLCFVRKAEIWKNIQARMSSQPDDPLPALEFAEVALGAAEMADALRAMDEAVRRVKPSLSTAPTAVRTRVFTDALKLLAALPTGSRDPAVAKLFQYAAESANDVASQVEYRFRFAEYYESAGEPARAIRLYQQIIRDRTLRDWPPARADATVMRSHVRATRKIDDLIKQMGADIYSEWETEARQWLEAAKNAQDDSRLEQLIESFPNSHAALTATLEHARLLEKKGRYEAAATSWERAYNQHEDPGERQAIIRHIAESYEKARRPELAYLWLAKAAREFPAATFEHAGRTTSFAEYRDLLSSARALVEPSRPLVPLPLKQAFQLDLVGTVHLLTPRFADAPESQWANVYVQNPDGIRGYRGSTGEKLWNQPVPVRMNADLLTARAEFAVFATPFEVFALNVATGERRYSRGEYPARLQDPGADWEDGTNFRVHALHRDRLVSIREDGSAECINIQSGDVVWTAKRQPAPLGPMELSDSVLIYHTSREGRAVFQIVSASTGELLDSIVTDEQRPVEDLYLTLDGLFIMVTSKSIACYDPAKQARQWQVSLNWPVRRATLQYDMDSMYFIDDAGVLKKIGLEDGRIVWESQRVLVRGEENETLHREREYLFVSTNSSISAVDIANGQLLWQGTTPENPHFVQWLVTGSYMAGLHAPGEGVDGVGQLFFYDHRNASGVIPKSGGVLDLGVMTDVRGMIAADGGVVVQNGSTIRGFTQSK